MDIQLEKKKGIQKKHLPYIGGGAVILLLLGWIICYPWEGAVS